MQKNKVIIDCDPGMDDSMAIVMAVKAQELEVIGITTVSGNYPIEVTTNNALKTLEMVGETQIPVAEGLGDPLIRKTPSDPFSHGEDGQANNNLPEPSIKKIDEHAVDFIIESVKKYPNQVTLVCCGPLSNIALAMIKAPEIKEMIKEIIAISGAFGLTKYAYTNATGDTPQSEWNVYVDPEAADIVYNSGVKFTALGLDIATHFEVDFSEKHFKLLEESDNKEAEFLLNAIKFVTGRGYGAYCTVIDCLAVAYAINNNLINVIEGKVGIETEGKYSFGNTVLERRNHHSWENMSKINIGESVNYLDFLTLLVELVIK